MDIVKVESLSLAPWEEIQDFQANYLDGDTDYGATASFIGTMRDFNEGDSVSSMLLEHYPQMTEQQLQGLIKDAYEKWSLLHSLIVHRVGVIQPGEPIVLVAVWSAHRKAAFEACRSIMESLKTTAPFWKKEILADGSDRWVEKNTKG